MSYLCTVVYHLPLLLSLLAPDVGSIEEHAARQRDAIVSGEIEYEISYGRVEPGSSEVQWRPAIYKDRMIFDRRAGLHAFLERWTPGKATYLRHGETVFQGDEAQGNLCRIIIRPDLSYEYFPIALSDGSHLPILESLISQEPQQLQKIFLPWNFNVIPDVAESHTYPAAESVIKTSPGSVPTVSEDVVDGRKCWVVDYHTHDDRVVKIWHDQSKDMAIIRVVMEGSNALGNWRNALNSTLQSYDEGGIWFPAEVVLRSEIINDKGESSNLVLHRIRVLRGRFNIEIPPDQFTVKALQPVTHTSILRQYDSDQPDEEWDGRQVVTLLKPVPKFEAKNIAEKRRGESPRLLLLVIGNALLVAALFVWLQIARRRKIQD